MMKKTAAIIVIILTSFLGTASAAPWYGSSSGSVKADDTGVNYGGGSWADLGTPAELSWNVSLTDGLYTYEYSFDANTNKGAISHWILELSADIANADTFEIVKAAGGSSEGPRLWGPGTPGAAADPYLMDNIFGIKYGGGILYSMDIEIKTSRIPMAGDFYAKDGSAGGGDNYFWADNVIPVPNTSDVPIPGTALLLSPGLIGFISLRRRTSR